jgi:hypothetical protein
MNTQVFEGFHEFLTTLNISITFSNASFCSYLNVGKDLNFTKVPRNHSMCSLENRNHSFMDMSSSLNEYFKKLSEVGFYYDGEGDHVSCFHCAGLISGIWRSLYEFDSWFIHAIHFPECYFLKCNKGEEFIKECLKFNGKTIKFD